MQIKVENLDKFISAFTKAPETMARAGRRALKQGLADIQQEASTNHSYTSRSGALDKAYRTVVSRDGLVGELFLDGRVSGAAAYAKIQHEGGTISASKIRPKGKALRWISGNAFVFAKSIKKDIVIKGGKFLTKAADKLGAQVYNNINLAIGRAIKEVGLR
jgi:hypothetical protein